MEAFYNIYSSFNLSTVTLRGRLKDFFLKSFRYLKSDDYFRKIF